MSSLEFGPKSHFTTQNYGIVKSGVPVGEIVGRRMGGGATITIGGKSYAVAREGVMSGAYYLEADGNRIARAERTSAFKGSFTLQAGGRTYLLSPASVFGRAFVLTENAVKVGSIARNGFFSRMSTAELPDDLALEVRAFLIWLVIAMWQRQVMAGMVGGILAGTR
jgi:hypothetical protein